jgi:PAS domain S-box-containing protein
MATPLKFLILEDSPFDGQLLQRLLSKVYIDSVFKIVMVEEEFTSALSSFAPDVILADNSLPQFNATEALAILRSTDRSIPFILVTGTVSEEFAANIIKKGADDYILKDRLARLPSAIDSALKHHEARREQKNALQKVIESELQYRTLIERISDGFMAMDKSFEITFVNFQAEDLLHRPRGYLKGKKMTDEFPVGINRPFFNGYLKAIESGQNVNVEEYSVALDKWIHATIYPSSTGVSVYFKDITEQRKAQLEALRSEEKYRIFIQRITDAFIALDKNWCYTYLNQQAGELIRRSPSSVLGKNVWEIFPDAVGSDTYNAMQKAMHEQRYITNVDYYAPLNLWQENHIYPSQDGLTMFIRNISEKKKLERDLEEQQRLENTKLMATALAAQEKERNAIGVELHDNVNQILASTRLLLSMVKVQDAPNQELIKSCMDNLQLAIGENRKISHMMVSPDLGSKGLSEQLRQLTRSMFETAGMAVELNYSRFQEEMLTDGQKLAVYRIAQEQCNNIIKYAKAGKVELELESDAASFTMTISDNGVGMDPQQHSDGIGIRNIKGRLSVFNGTLFIDTAPGNGFRMQVEIPLSDPKLK